MQPKHFCTFVIKFHLKVLRNSHSGEQQNPKMDQFGKVGGGIDDPLHF